MALGRERKKENDAWVIRLAPAHHTNPHDLGGKGARLQWLIERGFHVPPTWVISTEAFARALSKLPPACEPRSLLRAASTRAIYARSAEAQHEIMQARLPERLESELRDLYRAHIAEAPWGFAVRSSATAEDGAIVSMAGLAESVLGVNDESALVEAVKIVWASFFSGRALTYLASRGVRDLRMAVVIQPMVQAVSAGVMFTKDWQEGGARIINAGWGLGAPVVDGAMTPDVIRMTPEGEVVSHIIADKQRMRMVQSGKMIDQPAKNPTASALSSANLRELSDIAKELEGNESIAWDVEFACDETRVWVVQARPATGRGFPEGGDAETIWSNVNVGEALPGVATPLTWSIAGAFSEVGFRRAFAALGCRVPKGVTLVGNVHGRVYLNLTQFMKIAAQVPGLDPRVWFDVGGGGAADELHKETARVSRFGFYSRLPGTMSQLVREQVGLTRDVEAFVAEATRAERAHKALDLAIVPDDGLARRFRDMQSLLERTGALMLTCASTALGTHVLLRAALERLGHKDAEGAAQELTTGISDLESALPARALADLVNAFRSQPDLLDLQPQYVGDLPDGSAKAALVAYLDKYGDRSAREAELSTPRWREQPAQLFALIRAALRNAPLPLKEAPVVDGEARLRSFSLAQRAILTPLVRRARHASRLREQMRTWVTRVLGMIRDAALDANRRLLRLSPELAEEDAAFDVPSIFFLTIDEVVSVLKSSRTDFSLIVQARRGEFIRDNARPDPPHVFKGVPPTVLHAPFGPLLKGLGASRGIVEGIARVVKRVDEMVDFRLGEVLVTRTTDIGWTPLFPLALGIVTELGGPLSHAALVARELSVPCVVNIEGATVAIRSGDRIRIDGDSGTVEKLSA